MDQTPTLSNFDDFYKHQTPPWVIGEPQPAIDELERAGLIAGHVLDIGCGTGEHTILLARRGHQVLGVDGSPEAVEQARRNAERQHVEARFEVADALQLADRPSYDTVVDSALFHIFDDADRPRYVASLSRATTAGSVLHVLALSDAGRGFGPQVSEATMRTAFQAGWQLESLTTTTYRGVVTEVHAAELGLAVGTRVDEPAWLARLRRL
ncbi:class I SAM-dependent methyltransferase [Mycobacterium sp. SMC-4]|uniref:class I SAM-dependent methyltransferase n=1 Tax=Mycobacterium sp. SMC-4 TaxID=2857059 RepID=UPI0021B1B3A5|nr:class I SAM-dependent methyltransferase [Mycobacterium sp. SMC-4]UXA19431.1 class I SAM-dependent methyltransferase [Mycobacterium sp. SMC-4]